MPNCVSKCEWYNEAKTDKGTSWDGKRCSAWSRETIIRAPEGHAINPDSLKEHYEVAYGSENYTDVEFQDYQPIKPGSEVKLPRAVRTKAHARSQNKHFGGRGSTKVKFEVSFVKIDS